MPAGDTDRLQPATAGCPRLPRAWQRLGYTGSPGAASAEIGKALIRRYARVFGDLVLEHLGGGDVSDQLSAYAGLGDEGYRAPAGSRRARSTRRAASAALVLRTQTCRCARRYVLSRDR